MQHIAIVILVHSNITFLFLQFYWCGIYMYNRPYTYL